jgi:DNA-binding transcriptional LysR family regulator
MELNWLDDLVALFEAETLTLAAERRNVTQPAFTRRIQQIEAWLGTAVLDRSRRPMRVTPAVARKIDDVRSLVRELRRIRSDIQGWDESQRTLGIASQHSISVSVLPAFIAWLQARAPLTSITLRSENRDLCHSLLMTRQVAIAVVYETETLPFAADETLIEKVHLRDEPLCAVAHPSIAEALGGSGIDAVRVPIIAFPQDIFMGSVLQREILPGIRERYKLHVACETSHVPAARELALAAAGVAWLPLSVCKKDIEKGALIPLGGNLGSARMKVIATRISTPHTRLAENTWNNVSSFFLGMRISEQATASDLPLNCPPV